MSDASLTQSGSGQGAKLFTILINQNGLVYHLCVKRHLWSSQEAGHLRQRCVSLQEVDCQSMKTKKKKAKIKKVQAHL